MRAAKSMPGATKLFAMPAPAGAKRGKPESIKSNMKLRPVEPLHITGMDLDFSWYEWQIKAIKEDYAAGIPLMDMADRLGRDYREVAIMVMELAHFGRVKPRDGGVFGGVSLKK